VKTLCDLYEEAPVLHTAGVHVVSADEKTGIQALERKHPTQPLQPKTAERPGQVERREFEYVRHGTLCLIANFEIATGRILAPSIGPARTEDDFVAHLQKTVETDPQGERIFVTDGLNPHVSAGLVRWIAQSCGIEDDLGEKGKSGALHSMKTRRVFLSDPSHRIRFVYTPKHCSWLNQVEIWFSLLGRRWLKRGRFTSLLDLETRLFAFIDYFNRTMAKPFKWTFAGRPLIV
jgi:transposase